MCIHAEFIQLKKKSIRRIPLFFNHLSILRNSSKFERSSLSVKMNYFCLQPVYTLLLLLLLLFWVLHILVHDIFVDRMRPVRAIKNILPLTVRPFTVSLVQLSEKAFLRFHLRAMVSPAKFRIRISVSQAWKHGICFRIFGYLIRQAYWICSAVWFGLASSGSSNFFFSVEMTKIFELISFFFLSFIKIH